MESTSAIVFWFMSSVILVLIMTSEAGRALDVNEALQQILSEPNDDTYYQSDIPDAVVDDQDMADFLRVLKPETVPSKRIFCNSMYGCRGRKRAMALNQRLLPDKPQSSNVQKRPFCNGFFGCSNGKRSMNNLLRSPVPDDTERTTLRKRLFCNSFGCSNGKRSSLYDTLLERIRANKIGQGEDGSLETRSDFSPDIDSLFVDQRKEEEMKEADYDDDSVELKLCSSSYLCRILIPKLYILSKTQLHDRENGDQTMKPFYLEELSPPYNTEKSMASYNTDMPMASYEEEGATEDGMTSRPVLALTESRKRPDLFPPKAFNFRTNSRKIVKKCNFRTMNTADCG